MVTLILNLYNEESFATLGKSSAKVTLGYVTDFVPTCSSLRILKALLSLVLLKVQCILMHLTQILQDHSCSSFYCGLSRQIDPEYTGFVLCKRNMVS